jgi:hypothetical protein
MKPILAISFLVVYLVALLNPIAPYLNYNINKAEITKKYCENKDKPILKCEGKCHLKKQLEKSADTQNKTVKTEVSYPIGAVRQIEFLSFYLFNYKEEIPNKTSYFIFDLLKRIDQPPKIV